MHSFDLLLSTLPCCQWDRQNLAQRLLFDQMLTNRHSDHAAERDGFDPRYTHDIVDWGALKIERFVLCGLVSPSRGQLLYHTNVGWGRSAVITREEFSGRAVNQCDRSGHL